MCLLNIVLLAGSPSVATPPAEPAPQPPHASERVFLPAADDLGLAARPQCRSSSSVRRPYRRRKGLRNIAEGSLREACLEVRQSPAAPTRPPRDAQRTPR